MRDDKVSIADFKKLYTEVQTLRDELAIFKRKYEDAIYNLDSDNFGKSFTVEQNNMKAQIKITADALKSTVTSTEMASAIKQSADNINLYVTNTLKDYSTTEQLKSSINMVNNKISLVVDEKDGENVINSAQIITAINNNGDSEITLNANKINLTAYPKKDDIVLDVDNDGKSSDLTIKCGSETLSTAKIRITGFVEFSDLSTNGSTTINGSNIRTGTISAARIDTDNLSCTRLYSKANASGYYAKMFSAIGDFGIYTSAATDNSDPRSSSCIWGVYHSDPTTKTVNLYAYGKNYLGYSGEQEKTYPKGKWDFSSATVTGLSAIAVFG